MKSKIEQLVEEYYIDDKNKATQMLEVYTRGLIKEFERYSNIQYRKYLTEKNKEANTEWYLGTSEGSDHCVAILKKMLDENYV